MNPAKRPAENELKIARYKKKKEKNWVNAMLKKSKKKQKRFLNFSKHDIFSRLKCIFFAVTRASAIAICLFDTLHCPCWNFVFLSFWSFFSSFFTFLDDLLADISGASSPRVLWRISLAIDGVESSAVLGAVKRIRACVGRRGGRARPTFQCRAYWE